VPSGFSLFRGDVVRPPRAWLERTANVVRVTEPPRSSDDVSIPKQIEFPACRPWSRVLPPYVRYDRSPPADSAEFRRFME
jgi:hypothetical protein